jgi:hypothetical protein
LQAVESRQRTIAVLAKIEERSRDRLVVQGENKKFDLSGSNVRLYDKRNQTVGSASTGSNNNFIVGNLPEGNYIGKQGNSLGKTLLEPI